MQPEKTAFEESVCAVLKDILWAKECHFDIGYFPEGQNW